MLSDLADEVCDALSDYDDELCDDSHMYCFSDNLKGIRSRNPKYTQYESDPDDKNSVHKTKISDVFNTKNKKILFVFDLGGKIEIMIKRKN